MKVLLAAGGTAGHINPAIAIANEIKQKEPKTEFLFVGAAGGMEENLVPQAGYPFISIPAAGFSRSLSLEGIKHNLKTVVLTLRAKKKVKTILTQFAPDIVIGAGGYVSGPIVLQAAKKGIKTAIHEQNAYPGITNKLLAKHVDLVLGAFADAEKRLKIKGRFEVVGNPVREGFIFTSRKQAREKLGIPEGMPLLVSYGGSLGAQAFNQPVAELIAWHYREKKIYHIHAKGKVNGTDFDQRLRSLGVDLKGSFVDIREYINNMPEVFAAADLIISRAGAMTLSELQACGRASILIPSPNVTENHQYYNAMALVKQGAARIIEEKDLSGKSLIEEVKQLIFNEEALKKIGASAHNMAVLDSAGAIYTHIKTLFHQ